MKLDRRAFITASAAATAIAAVPSAFVSAAEKSKSGNVKFDLGLASYSFRMFDNDQVIKWVNKAGLKYVSLKDFHLAMDSSDADCAALKEKYSKAGLDIYGCGVVYMKTAEQVENAFRYAKALGCRVIVGVPSHKLLPLTDELAKTSGIKVAIHNHGPGDKLYPSAKSIYEKIKELGPNMGIALDIGHSIRIGEDPVQAVRDYADRIFDFHFKDMNVASPAGRGVICGRGVIDLPKLVQTLVDIKYDRVACFEYEIDKDEPFPGFMESLGFIRGLCRMC